MSTLNYNRVLGNARNNSLYGAAGEDSLDGSAGNDYLRGYGGNDILTGGTGADRFVFERTLAANGVDTITDFSVAQGDVLDLSLVGFARGIFNRDLLSNIIRLDYVITGNTSTVRVQLDLDGGGNNFQTWANLDGVAFGQSITMTVGGITRTVPVTSMVPVITSFAVSSANELTVSVDRAATIGLYLNGSGTPGTPVGTPLSLAANTDGVIALTAQQSVTTAVLRASAGNDVVAPLQDSVVYLGTNGNQTISGTSGADIIFGFGGDDWIVDGDGADTVQGGDGNDQFFARASADDLSGGAGLDIFRYDSRALLVEDTNIDGGADSDILWIGWSNATLLSADLASVRNMEGLRFAGSGAVSVTLGAETNTAYANGIQLFVDSVVGSLAVDGAASTVAVRATGTDRFDGNDSLTGGSGDDSLVGNRGSDVLVGNGGEDTLEGGDGNDTLIGGSGNDSLTGGAGADSLTGGANADVFVLAGNDTVTDFDSTQGDTVTTQNLASDDVVTFTNVKGFLDLSSSTTTAAFTITAAATGAAIIGGVGNDTVNGDVGNDSMKGGAGGDRLTGGAGADLFVFDEASDLAITFVFADTGSVAGVADDGDTLNFGPIGTDVITDFVAGVDQLDFTSPVFQGVDGAGVLNVSSGQLNYGLSQGQWGTVRGNYDAVNGVFTLSSSGNDTLLGVNTFDPQTLPASLVVLVGTPTISDSSFVDVVSAP